MAYKYDIFLSYPRSGQVGLWVKNHFLPLLHECLNSHLACAPSIFVDDMQPTGVRWATNIKEALRQSKLLVAVWTPPYFRSKWCVAEWSSMLERELVLDRHDQKPRRGLVYPVVYSDGEHFDERAKATLYRRDLSNFTYPYPCFKDSSVYLQFHDIMMSVSQELRDHLAEVPAWQQNWPVVEPKHIPTPPISLPRL